MKIVENTLLSKGVHDLCIYRLIRRNESLRHLLPPIEDSLYELDNILEKLRCHFQKSQCEWGEPILI